MKYEGIPKGWERIEGEEVDTLKNVNPKFNRRFWDNSKEARQYRENCANCVIAYEMRRRGYKVTAAQYKNKLKENPEKGWKDPKLYPAGETPKSDIEAFFNRSGEQSRVQIKAIWNSKDYGHTFVAEKQDGKLVFLEPQSGIEYNDNILDEMNSIVYWRIDTLEISDLGVSACEKE